MIAKINKILSREYVVQRYVLVGSAAGFFLLGAILF
jgi:hypothetical protein